MKKDLLELIESLSASDSKTLSQKALKMVEEVGELARAVLPFESASGTTHRFVDRNKILEEVADSLLVDLSIMYNIGFTYEELEDMVHKKAMKWAGLQSKERAAQFPVPFEIHITVKDAPVDAFKQACNLIGVKPLLLDLQNNSGQNVLFDLMTSQVHVGNNTSAYAAMRETSKALADFGFKVIREKIETVPWHPAAPSNKDIDPEMPPNCYFESHIAIVCAENKLDQLRIFIGNFQKCYLSKSIFKKMTDGTVKIMVTYREYDRSYEEFKANVDNYYNLFVMSGYDVEAPIVEFSVFDSKISHDAAWINSQDK